MAEAASITSRKQSVGVMSSIVYIRKRLPDFAAWLATIIILLILLFPFLWMLSSSLRPINKLFRYPPEWLPIPLTFENFQWALSRSSFWVTLQNSTILAISAALITLVVCLLPAYSLARLKYPGKKAIMIFIMATQMLPIVLLLIPLFYIMAKLQLLNTKASLLLVYVNHSIPFSVLMLRSYFVNLNPELEEAALVDGCTKFGALRHVTLPLSLPGLVSVALFVIVVVWNDIFYSLVLTNNVQARTVSVQLYMEATTDFAATNWGGILAESVMITLPVTILFMFLQKYFIQGLTSGAVKG